MPTAMCCRFQKTKTNASGHSDRCRSSAPNVLILLRKMPKRSHPAVANTRCLNFKFEISDFEYSIATPCSPYRAGWYCQSVKVPHSRVSWNVIDTTAQRLRCAGTRRVDALPLAGEWGWESMSALNAWIAVFGLRGGFGKMFGRNRGRRSL